MVSTPQTKDTDWQVGSKNKAQQNTKYKNHLIQKNNRFNSKGQKTIFRAAGTHWKAGVTDF